MFVYNVRLQKVQINLIVLWDSSWIKTIACKMHQINKTNSKLAIKSFFSNQTNINYYIKLNISVSN